MYKEDFAFSLDGILSAGEKQKRVENGKKLKGLTQYFLLAKKEGEIIAWSFGVQKSADEFFMRNSAVLPSYRRSGVYTAMLDKAVNFAAEQGFQRIYSYHKMSNNAVLIAKLKFGFVLSGFKVSDRNGCMAELTYFTNPKRKALYEIRVGAKKPDKEAMQHIV